MSLYSLAKPPAPASSPRATPSKAARGSRSLSAPPRRSSPGSEVIASPRRSHEQTSVVTRQHSKQQADQEPHTDSKQDTKLFFSPYFQEHKPLDFYGRLLATIQQYAKTLDGSDNRALRSLVWKELIHIAGLANFTNSSSPSPPTLPAVLTDENPVLPDGPVFELTITRLLWANERHAFLCVDIIFTCVRVNLAVLDLVYAAFLHAQRRYPDIFCDMFSPLDAENATNKKPQALIWGFGLQAALSQLLLVNSLFPSCYFG